MPFITEVSDEEEHMSTDRGTLRPYVTMRVVRAATLRFHVLLSGGSGEVRFERVGAG